MSLQSNALLLQPCSDRRVGRFCARFCSAHPFSRRRFPVLCGFTTVAPASVRAACADVRVLVEFSLRVSHTPTWFSLVLPSPASVRCFMLNYVCCLDLEGSGVCCSVHIPMNAGCAVGVPSPALFGAPLLPLRCHVALYVDVYSC